MTNRLRDKAWSQLGTSGSGNHFVEFGLFTVLDEAAGLAPGEYLALPQPLRQPRHGRAGLRSLQQAARELHPELPKELKHLAWLSLDAKPARNTGPRWT